MNAPEFLFDFGSPNAYLAHRTIPAIEQRQGIRFSYVPILLGGVFKLTNNQSPVSAFGNVRNKLAYERLERQRFIVRHGITAYRDNPYFPVNTLLIMRGAVAADQECVLAAYVGAMFCAMWEQGLKMDDPELVRATLDQAGLDGARLLALTQEAAIKDRLLRNTADAVERGVFGAPSFFVGDDLYFGKDRLTDVEAALALRRNAPPEPAVPPGRDG